MRQIDYGKGLLRPRPLFSARRCHTLLSQKLPGETIDFLLFSDPEIISTQNIPVIESTIDDDAQSDDDIMYNAGR